MRRIRKPLKDIAGALEQIALIKNRFSTTGMLERIGQSFNNEFLVVLYRTDIKQDM